MIQSLYELTRKGYLQALSFIFAVAMFILILINSNSFAQNFGGKIPYLAVMVFYGMMILFIHGVGFEIKNRIWQLVFMPLFGYIIILCAIARLFI